MQRRKKLKKQYRSKSCPHFTSYATDYCKLLGGKNQTRADFIAQNRGRNDAEQGLRWCKQGECSTCYFFNLEKQNHSNKYITKLRVENHTLTSP